ncbi:hypothetical protein V5O48_015586 [Marasmius crinis-equi]|uniref:Transposase n=1 Tax=Marasmius crinis-equi TaxID=585013 RepID=A0ABR3EU42_9AGAR
MRKPVVHMCPDGYYQCVIFDLAAFIADYPEQVYLAGIVQGWCCKCKARNDNLDGPHNDPDDPHSEPWSREWYEEAVKQFGGEPDVLWDNFGIDDNIVPFTHYFPRADIHEMLTPDLLHQVVKGCFKDMLVEWVWKYIELKYRDEALAVMDDTDKQKFFPSGAECNSADLLVGCHRISVVPPFPGLRCFPHGRRFKQWTGDNSKALMKVFLVAVEPYIPEKMSQCLAAFLDFCYLVRRNNFPACTITEIQEAVKRFHTSRQVFVETDVRMDFSIPRMHSMIHYAPLILDYGAPNGVCSSITESQHITAVKKPWRRSNHYNALSQILLINQRLDKLADMQTLLVERGLLRRSHETLPDPFDVGEQDTGAVDADIEGEVLLAKQATRSYTGGLEAIARTLDLQDLPALMQRFLYEQITDLPEISSNVKVFNSTVATFKSPSDDSGIRGMRREQSTPSYRGHERRDTVAVITDQSKPGFCGMSAARVLLWLEFKHNDQQYPCALVHWYNKVGHRPNSVTGM